jgi:hypothetical protein
MNTLKPKFITFNQSARIEKWFELAKQDNIPFEDARLMSWG